MSNITPITQPESLVAESSTVAVLNKSEIDQQIATAHRYPRSLKRFRDEALTMCTLNEAIAGECIYALPRDGKVIEGPSARFAEIVASAWGNSRAGARVLSDQGDFVTAQGVFHDLERNIAITYEVQRRIIDKHGRRFKPDMIGVTANAACSIALRNAILKGVPKAFWADIYADARKAAVGDVTTLANKRANAVKAFQAYGIDETQILALLGKSGVADITLDDLAQLRGVLTAIKDGDTTPEDAFPAIDKNTGEIIQPAVTESRSEALKQRIKQADKPSEEITPMKALTIAIQTAHSIESLRGPAIQKLGAALTSDDEREQARALFKAREEELAGKK